MVPEGAGNGLCRESGMVPEGVGNGLCRELGMVPEGVGNGLCREFGSASDGIQAGFHREMGTVAAAKPFGHPPYILTHHLSQAWEQPHPSLPQPFCPWRNPQAGGIRGFFMEELPAWGNPLTGEIP